jgi:SAM-dependent methyltransferase
MWPTDENREAWEQRYRHREDASHALPDAVRDRLPKLDGKHVLHLPCGTGEVTAQLMELGALVSGVDPSPDKLDTARERAPDAAFFHAELDDLPLQLRRSRFTLVYAGEGALASVRELGAFASAVTGALRKNGRLILHDWHPVFLCVDPVDLRWRESYFAEGLWRVGQIAIAFGAGLDLTEVEELSAPATEAPGRTRRDPRLPTNLLLSASKP